MLVILLVGAVLFWLNCIPTKFTNYSPARIMKDRVIDYKIHCKHQFGEYVQVVMKTTNLVEVPRTINALAAYPTGNEQGTWKYYYISTGKPISHKKATNIPVPENLPDRIHALAEDESEDFIILDNHGNAFVSDDDLIDDSSVDDNSVEVKTADDDDSDDNAPKAILVNFSGSVAVVVVVVVVEVPTHAVSGHFLGNAGHQYRHKSCGEKGSNRYPASSVDSGLRAIPHVGSKW